jgi:hypothetical protein
MKSKNKKSSLIYSLVLNLPIYLAVELFLIYYFLPNSTGSAIQFIPFFTVIWTSPFLILIPASYFIRLLSFKKKIFIFLQPLMVILVHILFMLFFVYRASMSTAYPGTFGTILTVFWTSVFVLICIALPMFLVSLGVFIHDLNKEQNKKIIK